MRGRRVRSWAPLFFRARRRTRGTHVGTINQPQVPVDFALLIQTNLQGPEDAVERAILSPAAEAVVDALPLSVTFGQITPWRPGAKNPEHAIECSPMIVPSSAAFLLRE